MIRDGFRIRPGVLGPGLVAGFVAVGRALSPRELSSVIGRGIATRATQAKLPVLEIGSSSRMRDAAYFLWSGVPLDDPALDALVDAASTEYAFWGRDEFEPYRALAAELPRPLPGAAPDHRAPWVVIDGISPADARAELASRGLAEAQLHAFAPRGLRHAGLDRTVVRWFEGMGTVAAVLGRASAVVTTDGPLALDAERLGRRVVRVGPGDPQRRARLVATVPPVLLGDDAFVRHLVLGGPSLVAERLADRGFRAARLEAALAVPYSGDPLATARRRLQKLREDPDRFFAESRFAAVRGAGTAVKRLRGRRGS